MAGLYLPMFLILTISVLSARALRALCHCRMEIWFMAMKVGIADAEQVIATTISNPPANQFVTVRFPA